MTCANCNKEITPERNGAELCTACAEHARKVEEHSAQHEFATRLHALTPRAFVTPALIAINVAVFILMVVMGVSPTSPSSAALLKWGATFGPYTLDGGWWRLLTSMFLHAGVVHIGLNMWVLWDLGNASERLFGNWRYLGIYLACGLGGGIASLWWHPMVVGVGASGAIFGLGGALLGALYFRKLPLPPAAISRQVRSLLVFIGYNVFFGLRVSGIDNAAHIGGLLTGIALGALLPVRLPDKGAAPALTSDNAGVLAAQHENSFVSRYGALVAAFLVLGMAAILVSSRSGIVEMRQADRLIAAGDNQAAVAKLNQAIAKDPKSLFAHLMLGDVYLDLNRYDDAQREFARAVELAPQAPGGYDGLGRTYLAQDKPDLAIKNLSTAATLDARDSEIPLRLGIAYLLNNQPAEAMDALKKSISLRPSAQAYYDLGKAYEMAGNKQEAIESVRKSAQLDPNFEPAKRALLSLQPDSHAGLPEIKADTTTAKP